MPWNGLAPDQTFGRTDGTRTGDSTWTQANAAGVKIVTSGHDVHDTDLKDGINACLKKDGGNTATSDIPMGGFTLTNIADAGARTEPASFGDGQDNRAQYVATVGGTADAITLTPSIAVPAYAAGQRFQFVASGTNTGAVTLNVSGLGAKAVTTRNAGFTALGAGAVVAGVVQDVEYDGTRFQLMGSATVTSEVVTTALGYTPVNPASPTMTGPIETAGVLPTVQWNETDAGADAKRWKVHASGGTLSFFTANDADSALDVWLRVTRSGNVVTGVDFDVAATELKRAGNALWDQANVGARINALGTVTADSTADYVPIYDASGGIGAKALFPSGAWEEIADTTVGAPVASVEHTFTAANYSRVMVSIQDISGSSAGWDVSVAFKSGVTTRFTLTSALALSAADYMVAAVDGAIGSTCLGWGRYRSTSSTGEFTSSGANGGADRVAISLTAGNIDAGRIITYGLRV